MVANHSSVCLMLIITIYTVHCCILNNNLVQALRDVVINFNPSLVVNYATQIVSLVRNVILTYSVSSGEALSSDRQFAVTMEDPIKVVEVQYNIMIIIIDHGWLLSVTSQSCMSSDHSDNA